MKSKAVGQEQTTIAVPGAGMAARQSSGWKGSKRSTESLGRVEMQKQKTQDPMADERKQPESSTEYHAVPTNVDFQQRSDVGYQDEHESKPYSHSLRMHLQTEGRCLVCWDKSHRIADCPQRSDKLKEAMEARRQSQRQGFRGSQRGGRGNRARRGMY